MGYSHYNSHKKEASFLGTGKTCSQEWTLQEVVRRLFVAQIPGVALPFWPPKHSCDSGGSREQALAGPVCSARQVG